MGLPVSIVEQLPNREIEGWRERAQREHLGAERWDHYVALIRATLYVVRGHDPGPISKLLPYPEDEAPLDAAPPSPEEVAGWLAALESRFPPPPKEVQHADAG